MGEVSVQQVIEGDFDELEDVLTFRGEGGEAVQAAAVMTAGFDHGQMFVRGLNSLTAFAWQ